MKWPLTLIFPLVAFLVSMVGTRLLIGYLTARQVIDHPNARSSHEAPTPRGAGIAVVGVLLAVWIVIGVLEGSRGISIIIISAIGMILAGVAPFSILINDAMIINELSFAVESISPKIDQLTTIFMHPFF